MMALFSLWLSHFSILVVCFLPLILLHWYYATSGVSCRFSSLAQKVLTTSLLALPFCVFAAVSGKIAGMRDQESALPSAMVQGATSHAQAVVSTPQNIEAVSHLSMADVWFPFVGLVCFGTIIGAILFILRIFIQDRKLRQLEKGQKETTPLGVTIFRANEIQIPFSVGVWRKRIYLPVSLVGRDLEIIKSHELNHCLLNHHAWSLLEALQTHVFWFNPLAHILRKTGNLLREIECDNYSVKEVEKVVYTKVLVETAESFALSGMLPIRGQGWKHKGGLKMRLENLLNERKVKRLSIWLGSFVAVFFLAIIGTFYFAGRVDSATEKSILEQIQSQYEQIRQTRQMIEIEKVPSHFIRALLVHEDQTFFNHSGISFGSIGRAAGHNLLAVFKGSESLQGGSTITQQLAKQFLDEKRSIGRKFREYKAAHVLERNYSKQQILSMYLNMVYFGNQTVGLAQAAQYYYQVPYNQLSVEQSAMLIPFLDAPAKYNIIANPEAAKQRQAKLLAKLNTGS